MNKYKTISKGSRPVSQQTHENKNWDRICLRIQNKSFFPIPSKFQLYSLEQLEFKIEIAVPFKSKLNLYIHVFFL